MLQERWKMTGTKTCLVDAFGELTYVHDAVIITAPTGYRNLIEGEVLKVNSETVTVEYLDYRNTSWRYPDPKLTTIHLPSAKFMRKPIHAY